MSMFYNRKLQILQIEDFEEKGILEILKKSSKTGDPFTAILDLKNESFLSDHSRSKKIVHCPKRSRNSDQAF